MAPQSSCPVHRVDHHTRPGGQISWTWGPGRGPPPRTMCTGNPVGEAKAAFPRHKDTEFELRVFGPTMEDQSRPQVRAVVPTG